MNDEKNNIFGCLTFNETSQSNDVDIIRNPMSSRHTLNDFYKTTLSSFSNTSNYNNQTERFNTERFITESDSSTVRTHFSMRNLNNYEEQGKLRVNIYIYIYYL